MEKNQQTTDLPNIKKRAFFSKPVSSVILVIIIFSGIIFAAYKIREYKIYKQAIDKIAKGYEPGNVENIIYDLGKEDGNQEPDSSHSHDNYSENSLSKELSKARSDLEILSEIKELKDGYQLMQTELAQIKNQDRLPKIIIAFVELQNLIELGHNYLPQLHNLELLSIEDDNLKAKVSQLSALLDRQPKTNSQIVEEFSEVIKEVMSRKSKGSASDSLFGKVKGSLSKLIIIRKTEGTVENDDQNIDLIIANAERAISQGYYQHAWQALELLPADYKPIVAQTAFDLKEIIKLNRINNEIFVYLKLLANDV